MNDPCEEEVRIIAQSRFYVNEEIVRQEFLNKRSQSRFLDGTISSCDFSGADHLAIDVFTCGVKGEYSLTSQTVSCS